jgi:hypothetical protein
MSEIRLDGDVALITDPGLTTETVAARLGEIFDPDGAIIPRHLGEEMAMFLQAIREMPHVS